MKKFGIYVMFTAAIVMAIMMTGCKKQAWSTTITTGDWTELISSEGETIYDGPSEYIDDEYEQKALTESEYNFIWNYDKQDFDKVKRGSCTFNAE